MPAAQRVGVFVFPTLGLYDLPTPFTGMALFGPRDHQAGETSVHLPGEEREKQLAGALGPARAPTPYPVEGAGMPSASRGMNGDWPSEQVGSPPGLHQAVCRHQESRANPTLGTGASGLIPSPAVD